MTEQLNQLGDHRAPQGPGDRPAGHTGGRSHSDITKFNYTSLQQELGLLNNAVVSAISLNPDSLLDLDGSLDLDQS